MAQPLRISIRNAAAITEISQNGTAGQGKVSEGKSLDRDIIPINYITQLKTRLCELASAARGS